VTGCKFDKQTTYAGASGGVLDFEEEVTGGGEKLVDVSSQYDIRHLSEVIQEANDAGCLKEEARAVGLLLDGSIFVGAHFKDNNRYVHEADE
jgi:hypothetical protein